eukprot:5128359-Amphidinium_carterae.2
MLSPNTVCTTEDDQILLLSTIQLGNTKHKLAQSTTQPSTTPHRFGYEGITVHKELHERVLYYMDESDIELLIIRAQPEGEVDSKETYQKDMEKFEERLWQQLEELDGKLSDNEDYNKKKSLHHSMGHER